MDFAVHSHSRTDREIRSLNAVPSTVLQDPGVFLPRSGKAVRTGPQVLKAFEAKRAAIVEDFLPPFRDSATRRPAACGHSTIRVTTRPAMMLDSLGLWFLISAPNLSDPESAVVANRLPKDHQRRLITIA